MEVNPPRCRVMDLRSRNGTFVNGRKVESTDVGDGDEIKAGHTVFRVTVVADEPAAADRPADADSWEMPGPLPPTLVQKPEPARPVAAATFGTFRPNDPRWQAEPADPAAAGPCPVCQATAGAPPPDRPALCAPCRREAAGRPQPIPGYQVVRELGRGGMGVVSLAVRAADAAVVALKTVTPAIPATSADVKRFVREAQILRQLDHPHIVACRDAGDAGGVLFFAMDFVPGVDGERLVKRGGPLPVGRAVGLACQLLDALEYAHGRGYVHRDIKPANLLVAGRGPDEVVRLTDFGLARLYEASSLSGITLAGQAGAAGTPAYMPPEHITDFRSAGPPADLYSAAASLYNLLTGRHVFDLGGLPIEGIILTVLQEQPVPIRQRRPDVPGDLAAAIHRALAKEPADRFAGAGEMREALLPFR
jgi:serine/threonine-protein kinase